MLWSRLAQPRGAARLLASAGLTTVATCVGLVLSRWLPSQSLALVYIPAVVLAAAWLGTWMGLSVAVLAFLAYNFFFIPPVFTFTIADPQEVLALAVFLAVALFTGSLAGSLRDAADAARRRSSVLQSLNAFAAELSASRDDASILRLLARQAVEAVDGTAFVLVPDGERTKLACAAPGDVALESVDLRAAERVVRSREVAYAVAPGWPGSRFELHPVILADTAVAVLGIAATERSAGAAVDVGRLIGTILKHTAIAMERTRIEQAAVDVRHEMERERLRSALLSSLSHDLRTPLASIIGSVTSLRQLGDAMPKASRDDLLATIEEEADRLARFVANLLNMTRIEAGGIDLKAGEIDVEEILPSAVARARALKPTPAVTMAIEGPLPLVGGNALLFDSVVFNLLDNSVKFSAGPAAIDVRAKVEPGEIVLSVSDRGEGIRREDRERVFEPFFRANDGCPAAPGTGLGLAIAKRIVEGMGGRISIESPVAEGKGTRVTIALPTKPASPMPAMEGQA